MAGVSKYTEDIAAQICDLIAKGQSSREVAKELGISDRVIFKWLDQQPSFVQQYARAREAQADHYFDEIVSIADELEIDATYKGEEVSLDVSSSSVARNRLRVDARKWVASKLAPKKYGEKVDVALSGGVEVTATERKIVHPKH